MRNFNRYNIHLKLSRIYRAFKTKLYYKNLYF